MATKLLTVIMASEIWLGPANRTRGGKAHGSLEDPHLHPSAIIANGDHFKPPLMT